MDVIRTLQTIDFVEGRVDKNSIHPKRLLTLVYHRLLEEIDPDDGEESFYILTDLGAMALNEGLPLWLRTVITPRFKMN